MRGRYDDEEDSIAEASDQPEPQFGYVEPRQRRASEPVQATEGMEQMNDKLQSALEELAHLRTDLEEDRRNRLEEVAEAAADANNQAREAAVAAARQAAAAEMAALGLQQQQQQQQQQLPPPMDMRSVQPPSHQAVPPSQPSAVTTSQASQASSRPEWLRELDRSAVPEHDPLDLPADKVVAAASVSESSMPAEAPGTSLADAIKLAERALRGGRRFSEDHGFSGGAAALDADLELSKSLASETKFIFPPSGSQEKEWGTLKSAGMNLDGQPPPRRRPSSGRRSQAPPRLPSEIVSEREESRFVYPEGERDEWTTFSLPAAAKVEESTAATDMSLSLGADSVDVLLARNEERLQRLQAV